MEGRIVPESGKRISRRQLLKTASTIPVVAFAAACSTESKKQTQIQPTETPSPRSLDVKSIAHSLSSETDLPDIKALGDLLQKNAAGPGALSFSEVSPLFVNQPIFIRNVPSLNNHETPIPVSTHISFGDEATITVTDNETGLPKQITKASSFRFFGIDISDEYTKYDSNILRKFRVAGELSLIKGIDELTNYLSLVDTQYTPPDDEKAKRILKIYDLDNSVFDYGNLKYSANLLMPFWADFLMVPSYLKAKDLEKFNATDLQDLRFIDKYSKYFLSTGALTKSDSGDYVWTENEMQKYDEWKHTAEILLFGPLPDQQKR